MVVNVDVAQVAEVAVGGEVGQHHPGLQQHLPLTVGHSRHLHTGGGGGGVVVVVWWWW